MLVQVGLCRTYSETTLLVFPRVGSDTVLMTEHKIEAFWPHIQNNISWVKVLKTVDIDSGQCDGFRTLWDIQTIIIVSFKHMILLDAAEECITFVLIHRSHRFCIHLE